MADEQPAGRGLKLFQLQERFACDGYTEQFQERFGTDGTVVVTEELAVAQAADWDWVWAAAKLLTYSSSQEWDKTDLTSMDAYNALMRPVWSLRNKALCRAAAAGNAARFKHENPVSDEAWKASDKAQREIMEPVWKAEGEIGARAGRALSETRARTFARLYIKDGETNGE